MSFLSLSLIASNLTNLTNFSPSSPDSPVVTMNATYIVTLGIFSLATISYLACNKKQRQILVDRFRWRSRRSSSAATPPRSLSPEKKIPNNGPSPVDYAKVFPPSGRAALAQLAPTLPADRQHKLIGHEITPELFAESLLPLTANYKESDGNLYTSTGFSVDELKALGDFPDYATLSGVPLPSPYKEFNVETAMPRPYRPFRWAYHQTMCEFSEFSWNSSRTDR